MIEAFKLEQAESELAEYKRTEPLKIEERQSLLSELNVAKAEAETLCMAIYRRKYKTTSPDFELCDSVAGVISQIDNMVGGLFDENASLKAELAKHQGSEFHPDWSLLDATRDALKEMTEKYWELLMAVETKHPDETRHQTALRYIVRAGKSGEQTGSIANGDKT